MKTCSYCGAKYPDDTEMCAIDHTPLANPAEPPAPKQSPAPRPETSRPEYELAPLTAAERQMDLVTLVRCGTLPAADLVVSRLRAAGIEAFIPDESLMQAVGWNLNTYGYVRVQVSPNDYDAARDLIGGNERAA